MVYPRIAVREEEMIDVPAPLPFPGGSSDAAAIDAVFDAIQSRIDRLGELIDEDEEASRPLPFRVPFGTDDDDRPWAA